MCLRGAWPLDGSVARAAWELLRHPLGRSKCPREYTDEACSLHKQLGICSK